MFISLDEKFTDQAGNIYEVENPVDNHYITYLYDETGNKIIARSDESEDFPKFYKRGWSTQECHDSLKSDWVIRKDKQQHIWDLLECCENGEESAFALDTWPELPTVEAFTEWLGNDFAQVWKERRNSTPARCASTSRLFDAMREDPSLIQAVR